MLKTAGRFVAALAVSGVMAGSALAADALRIGVMPFVPYAGILLAKEKGWVEEELKAAGRGDVKVSWFQFAGGPPVNEAFASRNIDIAALGDSPAIAGHASGIDTRLVGLAYKGGGAQALLVRADSPIKSVKELKGKKVATLRGGNVHELLVLVLAEAGLKLSDIEFINLGLQDMGTTLIKGDIDAALVWDPVFTKLESEGQARALRDGRGLKSNLNPVIASAAVLKQDPEFVRAYLKALERGADFIRTQPAEAAAVLAPIFGLTPEQLNIAFGRSEFAPKVDGAVKDELKRSVAFMLENRLIRNAFDVERFVDTSAAQ
ncbi:aliphatic sulfonate ABC transporter substrate-binding protein [Pseudothauera nasutitermitis]|uniref:Putative aliphatic sulfonates-binding protein n=1 Tax=Pseudothauera nasutitermitis TaxID=2565930 RepID=A0A4V3WCC1_9RHOO|nr:aliphatic sulfonate ABC transporter substrate-binding protein [Pseudothauera nasutitermitis]THF66588.1 aliphatic sulfonate ABC transporter substrate-binding protein [Pseudothauera nasutitermitis]